MEAAGVGDERTGKPSSCRKRKMPVPEIGGALTTECQEGSSPSPSGDQPGNFASRDSSPCRKRPRPVDDCLIHPPDGSEPIDLNKEAEAILGAFVDSLTRDVAFELHREMHTGIVTNERLWLEQLHPPPEPKPGGDVYGRIPPKEPSSNITCPSCGRAVGASRFAPHLDKCVLGPSRVRSSRSARSSPTPAEQSKSLGKPLPSIKPAAPKPAANKPSPSNPPKTAASIKPPPRATSRPSTKPSTKPVAPKPLPMAPGASPPPPPPAVHPPVMDKEREPLHILIKLVDGSPVQTYHRVVLMSPRTSKNLTSKSPPRRSSDASSDRTYTRDDGHRSSVPDGRTLNHKKLKGLVMPRGTSAGREIEESGRDSSKGRGSAGSRVMNLGPQQQSQRRNIACSSGSGGGGGRSSSTSVSRASSPVAARVPPPMFIPASRGSPPPSRQSGASGSKQKSGSAGSNSRYPVMT